MNHSTQFALFARCAAETPEGTFGTVKEIRTVIGTAADNLMCELRELGLRANTCDLIYQVEVAMYAYAKCSNPDRPVFALGEAFGQQLDGPDRQQALASATAVRDAFHLTEVV